KAFARGQLQADAVERQHLRRGLEQVFPRQCVTLHEVVDFEQRRFGGDARLRHWRRRAHALMAPTLCAIETSVRRQRTLWPALTATGGGKIARQRSSASSQRSAKAQPAGRS